MSKNRIAIIVAMPEEVEAILEITTLVDEQYYYGHKFLIVKYNQQEIIITICGIGKVNSAFVTSLLGLVYKVDLIINFGSALGMTNDQKIGDVVLIDSARFHDLCLDYDDLLVTPTRFLELANSNLVNSFEHACRQLGIVYKRGLIVSGDQFVSDNAKKLEIKQRFDSENIVALDMESCAILSVANRLEIDCIIVRGISDLLSSNDNVIDFNQFVRVAAKNSCKIVRYWLDNEKI